MEQINSRTVVTGARGAGQRAVTTTETKLDLEMIQAALRNYRNFALNHRQGGMSLHYSIATEALVAYERVKGQLETHQLSFDLEAKREKS